MAWLRAHDQALSDYMTEKNSVPIYLFRKYDSLVAVGKDLYLVYTHEILGPIMQKQYEEAVAEAFRSILGPDYSLHISLEAVEAPKEGKKKAPAEVKDSPGPLDKIKSVFPEDILQID